MFAGIFDFGRRRTGLQALGWYLVFLLIFLPIGGIAGLVAASFNGASGFGEGYQAGARVGPFVGIVYVTGVAIALLWRRDKDPLSLALIVLGVALSFVLGAMGGLIPLAFLTTRPVSEV